MIAAVCPPVSWSEATVYIAALVCITVVVAVAMLCTRSAR